MSRCGAGRKLLSLVAALAVAAGLGLVPAAAAVAASPGSLTVLAVDPSGAPVAGAHLSLSNQNVMVVLVATSGADGVATFPSAGAATWVLWVTPPAAPANDLLGGSWVSDTELLKAAAVPTPIVVGDVVRTITARLGLAGSVAGTVTARDGTPAAGAQVAALPPGVTGADLALWTVADATGHYVLRGVPEGPNLLFAGPGNPTQGAPEFWENATTTSQATPVTVVGGAQLDRSFALTSGLTVSGRLTSNQLPAAGVKVNLVQDGGFVSSYATTGADGTFQVLDLLPGQYSVAFVNLAGSNGLTDCWRAGANPVATDPCSSMTVAGDQSGLELVALAGGPGAGTLSPTTTTLSLDTPALTFGTAGSLTVRVASAADTSGAVTVTEVGQLVAAGTIVPGSAASGTAGSGTATLTLPADFPAGNHVLVAHFGGTAAAAPSMSGPLGVVVNRALPAVTLEVPGSVASGQPAAAQVAVRLPGGAGGQAPLANAAVTVTATSGGAVVTAGGTTAADGAVSLALPGTLAAGDWTVTASVAESLNTLGAASAAANLTVAGPGPGAPAASTTSIMLSRASVWYGGATTAVVTVTAGAAAPSGSITVRIGARVLPAVTLIRGTASVRLPVDLTPGTYPVVVAYAGGAGVLGSTGTASLRVTKASSVTTISVSGAGRPPSASSVGVRVARGVAGGAPASGVVRLVLDGAVRGLPHSLVNGATTITLPANLTAGAHRVSVRYSGSSTVFPSDSRTAWFASRPATLVGALAR